MLTAPKYLGGFAEDGGADKMVPFFEKLKQLVSKKKNPQNLALGRQILWIFLFWKHF